LVVANALHTPRGIPGVGVWLVAIPVPVAGGGAVEDADHAFDNVVDAGEITTVLAVVDDLDRLASEDGIGEFEQRLKSPGSIACVTRQFFVSRKTSDRFRNTGLEGF